jgi:HAD superfamily hydrolase (TIGR01549 family)
MKKQFGIIFDLCGTLYHSEELSSAYKGGLASAVAARYHLSLEKAKELIRKTQEEYAKMYGYNPPFLLTSDLLGVRKEYISNCNLVDPRKYLSRNFELAELIKRLSTKYKLAILTHSTRLCTKKALQALGIDVELFDAMVCAEDIAKPKPNQQPFLEVARRLSLEPSHCIVVGDRVEIDLVPAKKLKMRTILVGSTPTKDLEYVDYQLDNILLIERAILKLAG